jgi:hypothetical protein
MILVGPIAMLAGWLAILAFGNAPAVAFAVSGAVLLVLMAGQLMPRPGRPMRPSEPTAIDIEARHIRTFAESLGAKPRQEGRPDDGQH